MTDLFNSQVLRIEQPSLGQPHYPVTDARERLLAHVTQVAGGRPTGRLGRNFSARRDFSRVVVQVTRPDGAPLFFVDRAAGPANSVAPPPCAVVAPDGQVIGRFEHDMRAFAQSFLEGMSPSLGGRQSVNVAQQLFDAHQQPLCNITWETTQLIGPSGERDFLQAVGGRYCVFTDVNEVPIAQLNNESTTSTIRYSLQLHYQLPEPLRTLVIATPIAMGLLALP